jgi:hypothetical protein
LPHKVREIFWALDGARAGGQRLGYLDLQQTGQLLRRLHTWGGQRTRATADATARAAASAEATAHVAVGGEGAFVGGAFDGRVDGRVAVASAGAVAATGAGMAIAAREDGSRLRAASTSAVLGKHVAVGLSSSLLRRRGSVKASLLAGAPFGASMHTSAAGAAARESFASFGGDSSGNSSGTGNGNGNGSTHSLSQPRPAMDTVIDASQFRAGFGSGSVSGSASSRSAHGTGSSSARATLGTPAGISGASVRDSSQGVWRPPASAANIYSAVSESTVNTFFGQVRPSSSLSFSSSSSTNISSITFTPSHLHTTTHTPSIFVTIHSRGPCPSSRVPFSLPQLDVHRNAALSVEEILHGLVWARKDPFLAGLLPHGTSPKEDREAAARAAAEAAAAEAAAAEAGGAGGARGGGGGAGAGAVAERAGFGSAGSASSSSSARRDGDGPGEGEESLRRRRRDLASGAGSVLPPSRPWAAHTT